MTILHEKIGLKMSSFKTTSNDLGGRFRPYLQFWPQMTLEAIFTDLFNHY